MVNLDDNNFKFTVVGGGIAGWITALYLRMMYSNTTITVIESKDIGILGAGEGTTPHIIDLLGELNIPIHDIPKEALGTFKNGIKFTNWNGDGEYYYHGFGNIPDLTASKNMYTKFPLSYLELIGSGRNLDSIDITAGASERNAVKFLINHTFNVKSGHPIKHYTNVGAYALHFNVNMLAEHLKSVGKKRNIKVIEDKVTKIVTNIDGNITGLKLEYHEEEKTNFVFDCSGFKRLIIGNHYKATWKSYKNNIPANRALPFTIPIDSDDPNLPPYTEAIAMKNGWVWKISVQNRFGCGYVFDSNRISDDEAKEEIDNLTGVDTEITRVFSFDPGFYKTTWIKNCIAIGLSSGFIEPLEATSIWCSINSLRTFFQCSKGVAFNDQRQIDQYNESTFLQNENVLKFIQFHYLTKRQDTPFWKNFTQDNKLCEFNKFLIDNNQEISTFTDSLLGDNVFNMSSWLQVGAGLKFYNHEEARKMFLAYNVGSRKAYHVNSHQQFQLNLSLTTAGLVDHKFFIDYLLTEGVKF